MISGIVTEMRYWQSGEAHLHEGWTNVLHAILWLRHMDLLPASLLELDDFRDSEGKQLESFRRRGALTLEICLPGFRCALALKSSLVNDELIVTFLLTEEKKGLAENSGGFSIISWFWSEAAVLS